MINFSLYFLLGDLRGVLVEDGHESLLIKINEDKLLLSVILFEALFRPFAQLDVGVIQFRSSGHYYDLFETAAVVVCHGAVERTGLARPAGSAGAHNSYGSCRGGCRPSAR